LSPDTLHRLKIDLALNAFAAGALPWTPVEELAALSRPHIAESKGVISRLGRNSMLEEGRRGERRE